MSKTRRRYVVELTKAQLFHIMSSLEVFEMDLSGGYGFEERQRKFLKHHRATEKSVLNGYRNGLKTIK
tara:strand:+ start:602 stop:805 length:204 start_codon:yes stop_codon:yes gene_type:complete